MQYRRLLSARLLPIRVGQCMLLPGSFDLLLLARAVSSMLPGSYAVWSRCRTRGCRCGDVTSSSLPRAVPGGGRGFVVELEKFSGPLDLLLHLIREDEVDITDLPIAKIADQFPFRHPRPGSQSGGGLSRDGRAAPAHQSADAVAAPPGRRRMGGSTRGAGAPATRVPADPRAGRLARSGAADAPAERFGRGYEAPPPDAPPAPLQIDLNDLLARGRARHRADPRADAAPRRAASARRRRRDRRGSTRLRRRARDVRLEGGGGSAGDARGCAVHVHRPARAR